MTTVWSIDLKYHSVHSVFAEEPKGTPIFLVFIFFSPLVLNTADVCVANNLNTSRKDSNISNGYQKCLITAKQNNSKNSARVAWADKHTTLHL